MLRSESCDAAPLQPLRPATRDETRPAKPALLGDKDKPEAAQAARGFASVLYSQLFQEMQRTILKEEDDEEDDAGISDSSQDFLGMYMPPALSNQQGDPLSRNIEEYLKAQYGDKTNERDGRPPATR